jgi:hypothetical protein
MTPPPDPSFTKTLEELKDGGWIVSILGALGALCRLLISDETYPLSIWLRRISAGGILGVVSYFALHGLVEPIYEACTHCIIGAFSGEALKLLQSRVRKLK